RIWTTRPRLCRADSQRRQARGATRPTTNQIRPCHQPQNREGPGPHYSAHAIRDRHRTDRLGPRTRFSPVLSGPADIATLRSGYASLSALRRAFVFQERHMKRREFISFLGGVAAAWPLAAQAQELGRVRRIGVLMALADSDPQAETRIAAFQRELQNLGWTVGRNVVIEYRWAGADADLVRTFAAELRALRPDVVVTHTSISAEAFARETRTIPTIFTLVTDPIGLGLAASLAEPGGNATGFTNFVPSMGAKWVEFLKEFSPRLARVALLFNPETPPGSIFLRSAEAAARSLAVEPIIATVSDAAQVEDT